MQRKKQDIIVGVVFTIEKAGRRMRWKVIEHPYFDGLTLVRDYCGLYGPMKSGYCKEDDTHICGSTTVNHPGLRLDALEAGACKSSN